MPRPSADRCNACNLRAGRGGREVDDVRYSVAEIGKDVAGSHRGGRRGDGLPNASAGIEPETVPATCDVLGDVSAGGHVVDVVVVRTVDEADAAVGVDDEAGRTHVADLADRAARVSGAVADVDVVGAGPIQVHRGCVLGGRRQVPHRDVVCV